MFFMEVVPVVMPTSSLQLHDQAQLLFIQTGLRLHSPSSAHVGHRVSVSTTFEHSGVVDTVQLWHVL